MVAAIVSAPLINLGVIALGGDADLWPHLLAYVIPPAAVNTALLLAGVALVSMAAGVGTAWIVTTYDFPGRNGMLWLLPLPLAFPTYIVAYVYADLLGGLGPVQSLLRAVFGWTSAADYWFPNIRSLGGAVLIMSFVLYPYVYLAARAMFQTQSVALIETARGPECHSSSIRRMIHAVVGWHIRDIERIHTFETTHVVAIFVRI